MGSEFRVYISQKNEASRLGKPYKPLPESSGLCMGLCSGLCDEKQAKAAVLRIVSAAHMFWDLLAGI